MQFEIQREALLKPLQQVIGVIERRQTLPVLANFLVRASAGSITFSGTDLEVEMVAKIDANVTTEGAVTIPARKLFDIVRALPDGADIGMKLASDRIQLHAGRSRFTLSTLPASEFPVVDEIEVIEQLTVSQATLKKLIDATAFAMANQDVRYYLNGMLIEHVDGTLRTVATDGHRLAIAEGHASGVTDPERRQIILPRKGVSELAGLLDGSDAEMTLELGRNHLRVNRGDVVFTSKLIDGKFPDYSAVIPIGADQWIEVNRDSLRTALQRASILSNEKYRGVKLEVGNGSVNIVAHNPEQEEATEELPADTHAEGLSVGFNVGYLMDALASLQTESVRLNLRDAQSSCLIQGSGDSTSRHVIMPLRLG